MNQFGQFPYHVPHATQPATLQVAIVDQDTHQPDTYRVALALQKQVQRDFALPPPYGYGISCTVRVADTLHPRQPNEIPLMLFSAADVPGALGYHDETPEGLPIMKVFPLLDAQDGVTWSSTASHELLETLADPNICRCTQSPTGIFYGYEVCDAVEADSYDIDGVQVSNFCLPLFFEPTLDASGAILIARGNKLDYLGLTTTPFEIRPGGYLSRWDPAQGWVQDVHQAKAPRAYRQAQMMNNLGRASRRRNLTLQGTPAISPATPAAPTP